MALAYLVLRELRKILAGQQLAVTDFELLLIYPLQIVYFVRLRLRRRQLAGQPAPGQLPEQRAVPVQASLNSILGWPQVK